MRGVDYEYWGEYLKKIIKKHLGTEPSAVLDCCCGTGIISEYFSRDFLINGTMVTGIDSSKQMIRQAEIKYGKVRGLNFITASAGNFSLKTRFDAVLCIHDSINNFLEEDSLTEVFRNLKSHLKEDGVFIFDTTTEYNIMTHFLDIAYSEQKDGAGYVWTTRYDKEKRLINTKLSFNVTEGGQRKKYVENHYERIYSDEEIRKITESSGFRIAGIYGGFTLAKPRRNSSVIHYVLTPAKPEKRLR